MSDQVIYNCHIHTLTADEAPEELLKNFVWAPIGRWFSFLLRNRSFSRFIIRVAKKISSNTNDKAERYGRFLETGMNATQQTIFEEIEKQYPPGTQFVVLAMDTTFADLGKLKKPVDDQHDELLVLAHKKQNIIPFYAVDPRQPEIVQKVKDNVCQNKFRGIKIYPNLGYSPEHPRLMEIYDHCQKKEIDAPVMAHCSPTGFWKFGMTESELRIFSTPNNYKFILNEFKELRLCLAHFGGDGEWEAHLKQRAEDLPPEKIPWCKLISDMIRSGEYPNLYTDISYTLFMPRPHREQVEYIDYLKVLLEDKNIRKHVLFGSDFYMSKREKISEREMGIMLRSHLGDKLFFQIANTNPKRYLFGEE